MGIDSATSFPPTDVTVYLPHGKDCKWGRLALKWEENINSITYNRQKKDYDFDTVVKKHMYAACINTQNGDMYLDCDRTKLWSKFAVAFAARPLHMIAKTLYHLPILSWPVEVIYAVKDRDPLWSTPGEIAKKVFVSLGKNLLSIALTPICSVALIIIGLVATIFVGPFSAPALFHLREWTGKIEKFMYDEMGTIGIERFADGVLRPLTGCFSPIASIKKCIAKCSKKHRFNTDHNKKELGENPVLRALNDFGRAQIKYMRQSNNIFNNGGKKLDPDVEYVSPAYMQMQQSGVLSDPSRQMTIQA